MAGRHRARGLNRAASERFGALEPVPVAIVVGGLLVTAAFTFGLVGVADRGGYESWVAALVGPLLFAATLPFLARQAARERDRRVFWLLVVALLMKLLGALLRNYLELGIYGGRADTAAYDRAGIIIAQHFRAGLFDTGLKDLVGTNFIRFLTGIVYTVIGPSKLGGFLVYTWLGFLGLFLFYRAFRIAVPEGRGRRYALLLFFLPSLLVWPSAIGKDAWMVFTLGVATFGVARVLAGGAWRGVLYVALGLWLAALVRPHVAGMVGLALVTAWLLRRSRAELRELAPIVKGIGLVVLIVLAGVLVVRADEFLRRVGIQTDAGLTSVLQQAAERTGTGGSEFVPSVMQSPIRAPLAFVTVLYRPLLFEANNIRTLVASLETTFLLALTILRLRWVRAAFGSARRQPYIAFAAVYCLLFVLAFSAIANLGILVRERVQVLPFFLVLLCVPPVPRVTGKSEGGPHQMKRVDVVHV